MATDSESPADTACEMAYALCELALADGADANAVMMGASWTQTDSGFEFKAGDYTGSFTADDVAAAMMDEEQEETGADAEEPA